MDFPDGSKCNYEGESYKGKSEEDESEVEIWLILKMKEGTTSQGIQASS